MPKKLLLYCTLIFFLAWIRLGQPIYTDDITYLMLSSRYLIEGGRQWWFLPHCLGTLTTDMPLLWQPYALLRSLLASLVLDTVAGLDAFTVVRAATAVSLSALLARKAMLRPLPWHNVSYLASCVLLLIGTVPAYLVSGRPETTLVILLLLSLITFLWQQEAPLAQTTTDKAFYLLTPFFHVLLFAWGASLHPQIVTFLPYFLFVILASVRSSIAPRLIGSIFLLGIAMHSVHTWGKLFVCSTVPWVEDFFLKWAVHPSELLSSLDAWSKAFANLLSFSKVFGFLEFYDTYPFELLENHRPIPEAFNKAVNLGSILVALLLLSLSLLWSAALLLSKTTPAHYRRRVGAAAALLLSLGAWAASRGKSPYVVAFPYTTLVSCYLLLAPVYMRAGRMTLLKRPAVIGFSWLTIVTAALSCSVLIYSFGGFSHGFDSIKPRSHTLDFSFHRSPEMVYPQRSKAFLKHCGISELPEDAHIVVDETTFFLRPEQPGLMLMMFVGKGPWSGFNSSLASFKELGASAFVLPCSRYPELIETQQHLQEGALCCAVLKDSFSAKRPARPSLEIPKMPADETKDP